MRASYRFGALGFARKDPANYSRFVCTSFEIYLVAPVAKNKESYSSSDTPGNIGIISIPHDKHREAPTSYKFRVRLPTPVAPEATRASTKSIC